LAIEDGAIIIGTLKFDAFGGGGIDFASYPQDFVCYFESLGNVPTRCFEQSQKNKVSDTVSSEFISLLETVHKYLGKRFVFCKSDKCITKVSAEGRHVSVFSHASGRSSIISHRHNGGDINSVCIFSQSGEEHEGSGASSESDDVLFF